MGKKIDPKIFRIGITTNWRSRWFSSKDYQKNLQQDIQIRNLIMDRWKNAAVADVEIERSSGKIKVIIKTSRPGILIGRGGTGIEDIQNVLKTIFFGGKKNVGLSIDIQEVKRMEENAMLVGQEIAAQLEKRIPFRRILKSMIDQVMEGKVVKGAKIEVSGRLDGAEMSRREWTSKGSLPLHTLRADIDHAKVIARTTYGVIGIKVWIYKGEKFDNANSR